MSTSILLSTALAFASLGTAQAEDSSSDFAQNTIIVGGSPFGGSVNYNYSFNQKTTFQASFGGLPSLDLMSVEIDGTSYDLNAKASWMGAFINHRPVENAQWFRINMGFAVGTIRNTLTDADGNSYKVEYRENPVGYVGIGFGYRPIKGFQYGFDIGGLFGAGANVYPDVGNTSDAADEIAQSSLFGDILPNMQVGVGWGF
jgi:hypothetical protein